MAAFGRLHLLRAGADFPADGRARGANPQRIDGLHQPLSVAERDTELLEVTFRQFRQHVAIDRVRDEDLFVFSQSQVSQPAANVHNRGLIYRVLSLYSNEVAGTTSACLSA